MPVSEVERVQILFHELIRAPATAFPFAKNAALNVPNEQGVYVIEDANGKVLHVGRTKNAQGELQQRPYDHDSSHNRRVGRGRLNQTQNAVVRGGPAHNCNRLHLGC
jgi:hypothetical protein